MKLNQVNAPGNYPALLDTFSGIAGGLYAGFRDADDELPRLCLEELLDQYFRRRAHDLLA